MGVTSRQGGQESWPQGKGAQVVTRDTPSRYAKCESPKGGYLSPSLEGYGHWKAQCGEESHAAFGEGPMEKGCAHGTSPAAYSTWRGADGCARKATDVKVSRNCNTACPAGRTERAYLMVLGRIGHAADRSTKLCEALRET